MGGGASKSRKAGKQTKAPPIQFRRGGPKMPYTRITPMFNKMLYRCYREDQQLWFFYNDTKDMIIHVGILFDYDSRIMQQGKTMGFRIDDPDEGNEDDFGKFMFEVDIKPGETEPFVSGTVTGWRVDTLEARYEEDETRYRL